MLVAFKIYQNRLINNFARFGLLYPGVCLHATLSEVPVHYFIALWHKKLLELLLVIGLGNFMLIVS